MSENRRGTLGELNYFMRQHANLYEASLEGSLLDDIRPDIIRMRTAVDGVFGKRQFVIAGEQSMPPIPKMAAKLIAMKALTALDDQTVAINLRADHDLVLSESEILSMYVPHPGNNDGFTRLRLLSDKHLHRRQTISGISLTDPATSEYIGRQLTYFANNTFPDAYLSSLKLLGRSKSEREEGIAQSYMVMEDWLSCFGFDTQGNRLQQMPDHLLFSPDHIKKRRLDGAVPQIDIRLPSNLAQANENWYLWLQRQLGIESQYTLSEGFLDSFLLQNGGMEILQKRFSSTLRKLQELGYEPVTSDFFNQRNTTFFNLEKDGLRYYSYFDQKDDSVVRVVDPLTGQELKLGVDELLHDDEWMISLTAVPRVALYSLAGFGAHIKGGGSRYNYDAKAVVAAMDMPYFPLWNFAERINECWSSPIQYNSIAKENSRHGGRLSQLKKEGAIDQVVAQGKISLLDLMLSVNSQEASLEIEKWIEQKGGDISPEDRIILTNRAGREP